MSFIWNFVYRESNCIQQKKADSNNNEDSKLLLSLCRTKVFTLIFGYITQTHTVIMKKITLVYSSLAFLFAITINGKYSKFTLGFNQDNMN